MASTRELMVTEMTTATSDETVAAVASRMSANKIGAVLVIDQGGLHGLLSEREPKIAKDRAVATLGKVTQSTVLKLALLRGLDALEQEYK